MTQLYTKPVLSILLNALVTKTSTPKQITSLVEVIIQLYTKPVLRILLNALVK